jgi:hypothetical protein
MRTVPYDLTNSFFRNALSSEWGGLDEATSSLRLARLTGELAGVCGLLESLLAAEPGLAGRLDCLVGQLARYTPDPPLIAWLRRMFSLLASLDKSLLKDVSIGQCCGSGSLASWISIRIR